MKTIQSSTIKSPNKRGSALVEFSMALPAFILLTIIGVQVLHLGYIYFRLQSAADGGARYASLMVGTNRSVSTEQRITAGLWGINNTTLEFCPVTALTPSGDCPTSSGANRDAGLAEDYLHVRTSATVNMALWPTPVEINAVRVIRNEAF